MTHLPQYAALQEIHPSRLRGCSIFKAVQVQKSMHQVELQFSCE